MLRSPLRVSDDHLRFGGWGVHYAWIIVLLAATMWMISSSFRFAAVVLVPHLQDPVDGFGWSKWAIAIAFSLQWVISAVMSPVLGGLGERYGVRPILVLGAVLFLAGMVLCGYMTSLWQFYLYFGILLGIAMTVFQVPLVSSVTVWFRTNLGAAMGGMQALQSLGTVTMIPLIAVLFAGVGLNWTFWIPGIAGGILLFLMIPPFFNEPAQAKMRPYGAAIGELVVPVQRDEETKIRNQVFFGEARRTHAFWNLIGIHFWGCMGHNVFIVFLVAMAQDVGVSASLAVASFVTLQSSSMIARFAVPIVADHIGAKNVMKVCFSLQVLPPHPVAGNSRPVGVLRFCRPVRYRIGWRSATLPHHQPAVFRSRPHRCGLRLGDAGQRLRHGHWAHIGRLAAGLREFPERNLDVHSIQRDRPHIRRPSARHDPRADA